MKKLNHIFLALVAVLGMSAVFTACDKADSEFVHDNNLLTTVRIKPDNAGPDGGIVGKVVEYNADGVVVPADQVTLASVKGGYGVVLFILDPSLRGVYNPEHCYLQATLSYDQIIRPGLAGVKNICNRDAEGVAQGIEVTVTSGTGDVRPYRIIGYFEGEYKLTEE